MTTPPNAEEDSEVQERLVRVETKCSIPDCTKGGKIARGWCSRHYKRWQIHGDPLFVHPFAAGPGRAGANHPMWKARSIGYTAAHLRISAEKGPAREYACVDCAGPAAEWSYTGADPAPLTDDVGRTYSDDPAFYVARCASCHRRHDGGWWESHDDDVVTHA